MTLAVVLKPRTGERFASRRVATIESSLKDQPSRQRRLILITLTVGLNPRLKSKAAKRQGHAIVISRKNLGNDKPYSWATAALFP